MLEANDVAKYFLSKDPERVIFNRKIIEYNGRKSYEGNVRINKYLFLAQVVYLAKYESKLFSDEFIAYDNGPIIKEIMVNFQRMTNDYNVSKINTETKTFLDKIYFSLENAECEELIEISHDDPEWQRLSNITYNGPIMNLEQNIDKYKKKYKGLIDALKL